MKNIMIFVGIIMVAIFIYQFTAPILVKHGVDMNVTSLTEDTSAEEIDKNEIK